MYAFFKGTIADTEEDALIVEVNSIGYRIYVPKDMILSSKIGSSITVYTYTCVREDAFILYGFSSKEDLSLFKLLITVSGVGPKMGLAILSSMDSNSIRTAIIMQDAKLLSSAPGVGAKTAGRIILELKDKVNPLDIISASKDDVTNEAVINLRQEAYEALISLGVSNLKATQALNEIEITEDSKIEDIIKQLLTKI
ncbi:MAG: Holliday junction branch migration protein RuvA [Lachnospiraceae bacterium]|nr:Holliday junction branch migration protein RuvA [Lachnospiraceae bacterium]MBP5415022.1 Holliday junction branch migration protein RuvA [Lachnospiraceae bacterium]MBP5746268.1 Holliday junction branch migration protein RuvA [Lachnospiraceae bacterium]